MAPRIRLSPPPTDLENGVRRAHLTLALLSTATHAALLLFELTHARQQLGVLGIGLGVSVVMAALIALRRVPALLLAVLLSYGLPLWLVAEVLRSALTGQGIPQEYYLTVGIVTVVIFSSLPTLRAFVVTALMLSGVGAAVLLLAPLDIPLLLYALFLVGMIAFLALYGQSVHTERVRGELLRTQAHTDPLTGVLNRRGGGQHLDEVLAQGSGTQGSGTRAAAMLLDIDRFKGINDTHGHALGDEVLTQVARAVQAAAGPEATVTRWGGEEFLVVWPDLEPQEAYAAASRLLEAIRTLRVGGLLGLTVSAGLAFASEAQVRDELVNLADRRMYAAKQAGGDRWL
ncbi:diguanylate cyclase [Deinococcus sp. AJ005]|uniref:GGDEF domain-containing protein n=1 Tax=Deinococcus sp. AJ005 TaxID=2652443 RepID=UPI00125CC5F2|nr:GGDEF domain-containing protein [Deinococcus sp. AJ005]QFP77924.1 GGDEF domain-containing protein [Deinococcus sp. AJ005]